MKNQLSEGGLKGRRSVDGEGGGWSRKNGSQWKYSKRTILGLSSPNSRLLFNPSLMSTAWEAWVEQEATLRLGVSPNDARDLARSMTAFTSTHELKDHILVCLLGSWLSLVA